MSNETYDFYEGQLDCERGHEAKENKIPDYYRGYGYQYEKEQIEGAECERFLGY